MAIDTRPALGLAKWLETGKLGTKFFPHVLLATLKIGESQGTVQVSDFLLKVESSSNTKVLPCSKHQLQLGT